MRKLTYFVAATLDGFIAGPSGEFDFFLFTGDHMAALVEHYPETLPKHVRAAQGLPFAQRRFDTVIMGRNTYEPARAANIEDPYEPLETFVFSRTLPSRKAGKLTITAEDPVQKVRQLKGIGGFGIWLCGGGALAGQLADEIDELIIKLHPRWAGTGIHMFGALGARPFRPKNLRLRDEQRFNSGVLVLRYEVER